MQPVKVLNMTRLFDKELLIYSFFDIRLKKPARVVFILYLFLLMVIWALPLFLLLPLNPYTAALMLSVPIGGASAMSKPIWGGKKFFSWVKTQFLYIGTSKYYYDCRAGKKLQDAKVDSIILVSRRRDYEKLLLLKKGRLINGK